MIEMYTIFNKKKTKLYHPLHLDIEGVRVEQQTKKVKKPRSSILRYYNLGNMTKMVISFLYNSINPSK